MRTRAGRTTHRRKQHATEQITEPTPEPQEEEQTFPLSYVQELRQEAAQHRTRAADADKYRDALREAVCASVSAGVLREPLAWSDDFNDPETGLPDQQKVSEAAQALAAEKPWLSRPAGDVGQGFRGTESDAVNLADLLRAGA